MVKSKDTRLIIKDKNSIRYTCVQATPFLPDSDQHIQCFHPHFDTFFYEDSTGKIRDEKGQKVPTYVEDKSFRLKSLTDLRRYIKNQDVQIEARSSVDTEMKEAEPKKERDLQYNVYTLEDRNHYFCFLKEKLMKLKEAAQAANVNYDTARKWGKNIQG